MSLTGADSYAETVKPVVDLGDLEGVVSYSISPNGFFIAFIIETKASKKGDKEVISVWREKKKL